MTKPTIQASASHRENNFNFMRLFMATLVMFEHAPVMKDGNHSRELLYLVFHTFTLGGLAVDGFFTLSGYLIVQSWIRQPHLFDFLKKRILRIHPGFVVASLISALIVGPLGANAGEYFARISWISLLKSLVTLDSPSVPATFAGTNYPLVNGSLWTIAYEFRCYLLVMLCGILGLLRNRLVWLSVTVCFLALSVIGSDSVLPSKLFPGSVLLLGNFQNIPRLLSYFMAGGCFFLFRDRMRYTDRGAAICLGVVLLSLLRKDTGALVMPTLGAYAFFWFAFKPIPMLNVFKTMHDISYGVYLYGWPVQRLLYWYVPSLSPWLSLLIVVPLTYVCGLLSWLYVERPMLQLKQKSG